MTVYDSIVIGAGPAGTTVSTLLARQGYRVLLLEKSHFPRHKLCGEFIAPECLPLFDRLGVLDRMLDAGAKIIRQWRLFAPDGRSVEMPMEWITEEHRHALGLTRARMDAILLDRAREAGVEVREGFQVSPKFRREGQLTLIEAKTGGEKNGPFSTKLVIDASGRNGVFHHPVEHEISRFEGSRLFACKVHLHEITDLGDLGELFFFRDGYGGISNVEGDRTNLCFITTEATLREAKGDREHLLDLTMRSNPVARHHLKDAVIEGEWLGTGPISYGRKRLTPGMLTIGDAAAFIDPFTGSGILLALKSGELAARVINQAFTENQREVGLIAKRYDLEHRTQFSLRFRACTMLRNLAFRPRMRNAIANLLTRHRSMAKLVALSTRT